MAKLTWTGNGSGSLIGDVIGLLTIVALFCLQTNCQPHAPEKIPVGALFDTADEEMRSAFKHELDCLSKIQSRLSIRLEATRVNADDSYSVSSHVCQIMNHGVFAFFASHTAATISTIRSYSQTFHMPFILTGTPVNVSTSAAAPNSMAARGAGSRTNVLQHQQLQQQQQRR